MTIDKLFIGRRCYVNNMTFVVTSISEDDFCAKHIDDMNEFCGRELRYFRPEDVIWEGENYLEEPKRHGLFSWMLRR